VDVVFAELEAAVVTLKFCHLLALGCKNKFLKHVTNVWILKTEI